MSENVVELLFFDTFAHDNTEEINLDLVQFPKPVYVTEVRIIPLGARVQADFPGGVRLGATNPSQFQIEFFVNDLGKPGASTFETLGGFEYDQNGKINLECCPDLAARKIPTDGLVLKGVYTTITLAVYGTLTNNLTEQLIQPVVNPALPSQPNTISDVQQIISASSVESEWSQEASNSGPIEYSSQASATYQAYGHNEPYQQEFSDYYSDIPKDPRSYHHTPETDWEAKPRTRESDRERSSRDVAYQQSAGGERDLSRIELDRRERERDRERRYSRDTDRHDRDMYDRDLEYRQERDRLEHDWPESDRDRNHDRERSRRHDDSYRRAERYREEREERKRPRTPPAQSPKRPHTPHNEHKEPSPVETKEHPVQEEKKPEKEVADEKPEVTEPAKEVKSPQAEESAQMDVEEFEPILSDEDILDDPEHYQDIECDYSGYTNNDDIIRLFTPGVTDLQKYPPKKKYSVEDNVITLEENLKTTVGITDDYLKSSITKYVIGNFNRHNTEIKEEFIHLCEKLPSTVGSVESFCDIVKLYVATKAVDGQSLTTEDTELVGQLGFIVETVTDWLKIALNYEMANAQDQPAYKIRHIKCGVRLAEWVCNSDDYVQYLWSIGYNLHKELFNLYHQEFMALSIKLMILKALDTYLSHKFAIEKFLLGDTSHVSKENGYFDNPPVDENNGYKILVQDMRRNPLVRLKFALSSILKKLNLFEVLFKMHGILIKLRNASHDISPEDVNLITKALDQILNCCRGGSFAMSQPKRFLPVSAQFEIARCDSENVLVRYFRMFNLLQGFVLLLTYPSTLNLPPIKTPIFEIISVLLENLEGLRYLSENSETVNVLLKCLLRSDDYIEVRSYNLGLRLAYKLQALYHIEALLDLGEKHGYDVDALEIIDQLHGLVCLSFSNVGKCCVGEVLGMGKNFRCLLQFFDNSPGKSELHVQKLKKSPASGYIVDLLYFAVVSVANVPFLEKYHKNISNMLNLLSTESVISKINELHTYLAPMADVTQLNYDNIAPYVELVERNISNAVSSPGSLVTSLRIIHHLGISKHSNKTPVLSENPLSNYLELKYKHVVLQLYSLDGIAVLVKLLQKICDHYELPGLHSYVLTSNRGLELVNIVGPAVALLKQMLAYVVQCRNVHFKDLTSIPVLLQTYNLLCAYPVNSAGYVYSQEARAVIVDALLVYTQPVDEKDSLSKTLWTQMCGEVLKYTISAPYCFVPGLLVLSELLPLPLPIQTRDDLAKDETSWAVNLRKLWSAHLHPHSSTIQEIVNKLCVSTQPQLLNLLRRFCVQISDLAANSALVVARGILDTIHDALKAPGQCTGHTARLLNFLACLVTHGSIKCAALHLIHTSKAEEKYTNLIPSFCRILRLEGAAQAQECILSVVQSFCDVEITLMQTRGVTSELYLANALPVKDHLLTYINVMLDHLSSPDNSFVTYLPIVRTLLLLTEHDYGFYHLKDNLVKRNDLFSVVLNKLSENFSKTSPECLSTLNTLVEFLRVCLTTEENDGTILYTPRTITLTIEEVRVLVGWPQPGADQTHPFLKIEEVLKKEIEEDTNFETILEGLTLILKHLNSSEPEVKKEADQEVVLPPPEPLLSQFDGRVIYSSSDACDERLTERYWLAAPNDEAETDLETVSCDLLEICRQLPAEFNLVKEVERLCHISRTASADVVGKDKEIDAQRGKTKKPFVTPMRPRNFTRPAQQRPDLFRSRPPNTSRPPSLHVDDFVALETCGAQPTGPTGYNKISRELLASTRMARGSRGRAFVTSERSMHYNRQMPWWGAGMFMGRGPYF